MERGRVGSIEVKDGLVSAASPKKMELLEFYCANGSWTRYEKKKVIYIGTGLKLFGRIFY